MPSKAKKGMKKSKGVKKGKSLQPVKPLTKAGGQTYLKYELKDVIITS